MARRLLDKLPAVMQDPTFAAEWEEAEEEFASVRAKSKDLQRTIIANEEVGESAPFGNESFLTKAEHGHSEKE